MQIRDAEREALTGLPWHPFVSGLVDTFHDHRNYYLLMELAPCQSFDAFLTKHGPLRSEDARFYFANLTLALEFLHTHGVIHRDLKPQNILMGADGYLMIGDFGVSAHITDGNNWKNVGTYPYTAPEFYGETYDTRVVPPILRMAGDWWAAAVILFQMVTLDWPFNEPSEELLYKRIMCSKPGEFWERDEFQDLYIDPELKDLVNMMLMRDVASRYGTIAVKAPGDKLARNDEVRIHPFMHGKVDWIRMNHRLVIVSSMPHVSTPCIN
ncbi:cAMP dependent protein kinase [Rhodofomes roseus]|uniref:cAMP-dependent protein kinase n=1 Tax=Rhodofomes roseus TaxID=34475 RepID=A0ABQ8K6U6_9APHY|nr:cAMP dependent protein kinase [Rhodofomes roseus]KAH9832970.1 cAMP dependent protein kinase [Rhodofomes roseus]